MGQNKFEEQLVKDTNVSNKLYPGISEMAHLLENLQDHSLAEV